MPDWRALTSSDCLRAFDLGGKPRLVTIKRVTQGKYGKAEKGRKEKRLPDIYFDEYDAPLGSCPTNSKQISKLLGTTVTEEWIGRKIVLYPTEVEAFGATKEAIRVDPRLPKADPGPRRNQRGTPPTTEREAVSVTKDGEQLHDPHPMGGPNVGDTTPGMRTAMSPPGGPPISKEEAAEILRKEREEQNR